MGQVLRTKVGFIRLENPIFAKPFNIIHFSYSYEDTYGWFDFAALSLFNVVDFSVGMYTFSNSH